MLSNYEKALCHISGNLALYVFSSILLLILLADLVLQLEQKSLELNNSKKRCKLEGGRSSEKDS